MATSTSHAARHDSAGPCRSTPAASTPRASYAGPSSPCPNARASVDTNSSPAERAEPRGPVEVAVLGSASIREDDPRFEAARQLGGLLAAEGWTVVTGGYGGLMVAASRGARERGGNVVGLPMSGWATISPNPWSTELRWADSYGERLGHLLACDAVVALDG